MFLAPVPTISKGPMNEIGPEPEHSVKFCTVVFLFSEWGSQWQRRQACWRRFWKDLCERGQCPRSPPRRPAETRMAKTSTPTRLPHVPATVCPCRSPTKILLKLLMVQACDPMHMKTSMRWPARVARVRRGKAAAEVSREQARVNFASGARTRRGASRRNTAVTAIRAAFTGFWIPRQSCA